jgi:hypothetical protein
VARTTLANELPLDRRQNRRAGFAARKTAAVDPAAGGAARFRAGWRRAVGVVVGESRRQRTVADASGAPDERPVGTDVASPGSAGRPHAVPRLGIDELTGSSSGSGVAAAGAASAAPSTAGRPPAPDLNDRGPSAVWTPGTRCASRDTPYDRRAVAGPRQQRRTRPALPGFRERRT